jgi:hypothetical protein
VTEPHASTAWSDERIIAALGSLRAELRVPEAPLVIDIGSGRIGRRTGLVAAAVLLVVAVLGAAITPAREAVADWLGIGSTEVRVDPDAGAPSPSMPTLADGARDVTASDAAAELGRPLPPLRHPDTDAPPQYAIPVEGGVLVRWPGRADTLWLRETTEDSPLYLKKFAAAGDEVVAIGDLGDGALWLGARHVLVTPGRALRAEHVLLWIDDGLELRLEGNGSQDEMVAIARSLR